MGDMKWRQIKLFGLEAGKILRPDAEFKSANLPEMFGMEAIEVAAAHTKAAKAEVASWKNKPEGADKIQARVAWWLAFGDALVLTGIGPHDTDKKGKATGLSPAIDYAKRTRRRDDISATAKAKGFLTRAGLDPDDFDLPVSQETERVGGNGFGFGQIEAKTEAPPVPQTATPANGKLEELAKALKAAGFSLPEIVAALKSA